MDGQVDAPPQLFQKVTNTTHTNTSIFLLSLFLPLQLWIELVVIVAAVWFLFSEAAGKALSYGSK